MLRKCFWLDTCLVPLSLKHLRCQGCAKLLLMVSLNMPLFRKCEKSVSILLLLFSCCSFIIGGVFVRLFEAEKHPRCPGENQWLGLSMQWPPGKSKLATTK